MKKMLKSANTNAVLQGIGATLAVIHPTYAPMIAIAMGLFGVALPGYIPPAQKPAPKAE